MAVFRALFQTAPGKIFVAVMMAIPLSSLLLSPICTWLNVESIIQRELFTTFTVKTCSSLNKLEASGEASEILLAMPPASFLAHEQHSRSLLSTTAAAAGAATSAAAGAATSAAAGAGTSTTASAAVAATPAATPAAGGAVLNNAASRVVMPKPNPTGPPISDYARSLGISDSYCARDLNVDQDYEGSDLRIGFPVSDISDCCHRCQNEKRCQYWVFSPSQSKCWIKDRHARYGKVSKADRIAAKVARPPHLQGQLETEDEMGHRPCDCPKKCWSNMLRFFMIGTMMEAIEAVLVVCWLFHDGKLLASGFRPNPRGVTEEMRSGVYGLWAVYFTYHIFDMSFVTVASGANKRERTFKKRILYTFGVIAVCTAAYAFYGAFIVHEDACAGCKTTRPYAAASKFVTALLIGAAFALVLMMVNMFVLIPRWSSHHKHPDQPKMPEGHDPYESSDDEDDAHKSRGHEVIRGHHAQARAPDNGEWRRSVVGSPDGVWLQWSQYRQLQPPPQQQPQQQPSEAHGSHAPLPPQLSPRSSLLQPRHSPRQLAPQPQASAHSGLLQGSPYTQRPPII